LSEKACRSCNMIVSGSVCPVCKTSSLSSDWSGYVIILDPPNSTIAKKLNVSVPGKYALRVR
jgi:DNA-directed RNA polymerase subunit E"